jgi:hypothetical protein
MEDSMRTWISIIGKFELEGDDFIFKGGHFPMSDGSTAAEIGNFITNEDFGGGEISATITFLDSVEESALQFILFYDSQSQAFIAAGIDRFYLTTVRTWTGSEFRLHDSRGDHNQLLPNTEYLLVVKATGSRISISLNGVKIATVDLPFPLPKGQCGLWSQSKDSIRVSNFKVKNELPSVFVVMQFTQPYNELYSEVIKPVCKSFGFNVQRADEFYGPGQIISDIERQIAEAAVIIAEISPQNPNVYYELGYSHALRKPTILIADKDTKLPFDVSSFRTLFYENTIGGKDKIENGIRKHLDSILGQWKTS